MPVSLWKVPGALAGSVSEKGLHSQHGTQGMRQGTEAPCLTHRPGVWPSCGFAYWILTFGTARARRRQTVVGAASRVLSPASCDGTSPQPTRVSYVGTIKTALHSRRCARLGGSQCTSRWSWVPLPRAQRPLWSYSLQTSHVRRPEASGRCPSS